MSAPFFFLRQFISFPFKSFFITPPLFLATIILLHINYRCLYCSIYPVVVGVVRRAPNVRDGRGFTWWNVPRARQLSSSSSYSRRSSFSRTGKPCKAGMWSVPPRLPTAPPGLGRSSPAGTASTRPGPLPLGKITGMEER